MPRNNPRQVDSDRELQCRCHLDRRNRLASWRTMWETQRYSLRSGLLRSGAISSCSTPGCVQPKGDTRISGKLRTTVKQSLPVQGRTRYSINILAKNCNASFKSYLAKSSVGFCSSRAAASATRPSGSTTLPKCCDAITRFCKSRHTCFSSLATRGLAFDNNSRPSPSISARQCSIVTRSIYATHCRKWRSSAMPNKFRPKLCLVLNVTRCQLASSVTLIRDRH